MDIKPSRGKRTVIASEYLKLDTDVITGGGTDETEAVQAILDKALEWGGLTLVMDGAATVRGIRLHSNTTIRCCDNACGFFLADHASPTLITNADWNFRDIKNENITLQGGTYNFNRANQIRYPEPEPDSDERVWNDDPYHCVNYDYFVKYWSLGMRFFGVRNLIIRDVCLLNQRVYAALFVNWEHVTIENVNIPLPDLQYAQNQDGLHFFGPGRDLVIRDIRGTAGDDFIALTPDEWDWVSSISDVFIDGVYLNDSDQGIRLLTMGEGRLDRITIRNVYGTYKSCGFFLNPYYKDSKGNFGHILIENVDLRQTYHKYAQYCEPFLFRIGGEYDSLTLRNIRHVDPSDDRPIIDISHVYSHPAAVADQHVHIKNLTVDGLQVFNRNGVQDKMNYISIDSAVDNLVIHNVQADREGNESNDSVVCLKPQADVKRMVIS
ncbi:MAG: hypothetical protein IKD06_05150, partial [Clostridia bacterium]|nr:hypothetical protein [Clostridia bacterium]